MQFKSSTVLFTASLSLLALACGDGGARSQKVPWGDNRTQVIAPDRSVSTFDPVTGDACLAYDKQGEDVCIRPQEKCGEEAADVVLDERGEVLDIICYPSESTVTVDEIEAQEGNIAQNENNAVLVLGDGVTLGGDLAIDANNVVVYGAGPDVSVISGDVTVEGNNTLIRGVRIQGDVEIPFNDAVFLFCVIEGNLTITGNNTRILGCDVYGDVTITGNNTVLASDRLAGTLSDEGKGLACDSNVSFTDENEDFRITDDELGDAIDCGGKSDK